MKRIVITDGVKEKRIRPGEPIPKGWRKGRPATVNKAAWISRYYLRSQQ